MHMTTVVWTTLITAVATVTASLGAIWLKGRYDDRAQARQAADARAAAREDQQRQAYGDLVTTARLALRNFRQLRIAYTAAAPDIPAVKDALSQTDSLAAEMNKANGSLNSSAPLADVSTRGRSMTRPRPQISGSRRAASP